MKITFQSKHEIEEIAKLLMSIYPADIQIDIAQLYDDEDQELPWDAEGRYHLAASVTGSQSRTPCRRKVKCCGKGFFPEVVEKQLREAEHLPKLMAICPQMEIMIREDIPRKQTVQQPIHPA